MKGSLERLSLFELWVGLVANVSPKKRDMAVYTNKPLFIN